MLEVRANSALAYLCSPTDCFVIPQASRDSANDRFRHQPTTHTITRTLSQHRVLRQNVAGANPHLPIVDSIVLQQGPNYFFAKRIQHWRAMLSLDAGHTVSSNVAPASTTQSVVKNRLLATALSAFYLIEPLDIFEPDTSNVLMTLLLLHDLHTPVPIHKHPLMLFSTTSVHNGTWTCAYQLRTILEVLVIVQYAKKWIPTLGIAGAIAMALASRSRQPPSRL